MTIFSKIIAGEIPAYKIAENDRFLAFLDIRPLQKGHTLVIPKVETDYIFDIADAEFGELMLFAKRVASAIKTSTLQESRDGGYWFGSCSCAYTFSAN